MKTDSGWSEYKEVAKRNKVSYSTFYRRVNQGMSPEKAATITPLTSREIMINSLKQGIIKPIMTKEGTQLYDPESK